MNKLLNVVLGAALIICICQLTNCSPFNVAQAESNEFVYISSEVKRTDDLQKGVSCYVLTQGRGISCVKTTL